MIVPSRAMQFLVDCNAWATLILYLGAMSKYQLHSAPVGQVKDF
jgi:hypothetical protein